MFYRWSVDSLVARRHAGQPTPRGVPAVIRIIKEGWNGRGSRNPKAGPYKGGTNGSFSMRTGGL